MSAASDPIVTVKIRNTTLKFSFEQIEVVFAAFTETELQEIPKFLETATSWDRGDCEWQSIRVSSVCLSFSFSYKGEHGRRLLFLRNLTKAHASFGGLNIGGGIILHRLVPERKWRVEVVIDKSKPIAGALYIGLTIFVETEFISYEKTLADGRDYFNEILKFLDLELPS